jgi:hypothetical protein
MAFLESYLYPDRKIFSSGNKKQSSGVGVGIGERLILGEGGYGRTIDFSNAKNSVTALYMCILCGHVVM